MSRHALAPRPDLAQRVEVACGWDGPLQTFFLQVADLDASEDEDGVLLWMGTRWREHDGLAPILAAAAAWADFPPDLVRRLGEERSADQRAQPPALLAALNRGRP